MNITRHSMQHHALFSDACNLALPLQNILYHICIKSICTVTWKLFPRFPEGLIKTLHSVYFSIPSPCLGCNFFFYWVEKSHTMKEEIGQDVNSEKAKYMFMSQELNAGQLIIIRHVTNPLQLWQGSNIRTTMANQNCIYEEFQSRMNSGTAGYIMVQILLFSP